jgi:hypothetical protein
MLVAVGDRIAPGVGIVRSETPMLGKNWHAAIVLEGPVDYYGPEIIQIP